MYNLKVIIRNAASLDQITIIYPIYHTNCKLSIYWISKFTIILMLHAALQGNLIIMIKILWLKLQVNVTITFNNNYPYIYVYYNI